MSARVDRPAEVVNVRPRPHGVPGVAVTVVCPWCDRRHRIEAFEAPEVGTTRWCGSTELAYRIHDPNGLLTGVTT